MINNLSIEKLYDIFNDPNFTVFFCCIERDNVLYRYKINKPNSLDDLFNIFTTNKLRRFENGLNSDDISVFDADFIDCY